MKQVTFDDESETGETEELVGFPASFADAMNIQRTALIRVDLSEFLRHQSSRIHN